jgi:hypothetical protein
MNSTIHLLESRQYHLNQVPSWLELDNDGMYFSSDLSEVPSDVSSFVVCGDISESLVQKYLLDQGFDGISESWKSEQAFSTRLDAELFAKTTEYRYEMGYQISSITLMS